MRRTLRLAPLLALTLAACAPPPKAPPPAAPWAPPKAAVTPDAAFRMSAPASAPAAEFVPPAIASAKLSNGVDVLVVERHEMPIVAVQVVVRRGAEVGDPGLGAFAGAMLLSGTKKRTALQISDAFASVGAEWGTSADYDSTVLWSKTLASGLDTVLDLLADGIEHASFPKGEIERERSKRLTAIAQERDRPAAQLANAVSYTLYPDGHPYKWSLLGTEAAVKKITGDSLREFHRQNLTPDRTTIVVSGDVSKDDLVARLEKRFGKWEGKAAPAKPPATPAAQASDTPRIVLVDRPGATQTALSIADVGVARSTEDYVPLLVMNTILGGKFSSRLNLNLREAHAYTYGARTGFDFRHGPGPFTAGGAIVREATAAAIQETFAELERIANEPVGEDELADAKAYLARKLPAQFETASETASTLASLAAYGLPLDEWATRAAKIAAVTPADVARVAKAYLVPDRMRIVMVGDAAVIRDSLAALGFGALQEYPAPSR